MQKIPLTRGYYAVVDDGDFEWLNAKKWGVQIAGGDLRYAVRTETRNGKRCRVAMHREILGLKDRSDLCDHIDCNGLNNQRFNLRKSTHSQNLSNQRPGNGRRLKGISKFNGKRKTMWSASCLGKYLGRFSSEELAVNAYNDFLVKKRGEFARVNKQDEENNTSSESMRDTTLVRAMKPKIKNATENCPQFRLEPELIETVESMRIRWGVKVSRNAFVNFLIRQGIRHHVDQPVGDTGESVFKK